MLKVLNSVTGVSGVGTYLTWVQSPQYTRSCSLLRVLFTTIPCAIPVATEAITPHSAQENSKEHPVLLVFFVFDTESHSGPDWPWPSLNGAIISMSHQTCPTYLFFTKSLFIEVLYTSLIYFYHSIELFLAVHFTAFIL